MKHTVYIASDHAGFDLKQKIIAYFENSEYEFIDMGPAQYNETDDYPDTLKPLCEKMSTDQKSFAVVIGGSGTGEAIVMNKYTGIRAALWYGGNTDIVRLARSHNDSNVLSLGARFIHENDAYDAIALFLETPFSDESRHIRRVEKVNALLP